MFYVYAIISKVNNRIYVGMTSNIDKRLHEHNTGRTRSTKHYRPWVLFFTEPCESRSDARTREKYWKSGTGKEQLKTMSR
ncbi:MAG: GIY-YIG nuclease family protein [Bacteroidales bacterium]|nr:GIY-YIG nuclease family protein [Bacteroidales bacterium]